MCDAGDKEQKRNTKVPVLGLSNMLTSVGFQSSSLFQLALKSSELVSEIDFEICGDVGVSAKWKRDQVYRNFNL